VHVQPRPPVLAYINDNSSGYGQRPALPAGRYHLEWINPVRGTDFFARSMDHANGYLHGYIPGHTGDLLLKISR